MAVEKIIQRREVLGLPSMVLVVMLLPASTLSFTPSNDPPQRQEVLDVSVGCLHPAVPSCDASNKDKSLLLASLHAGLIIRGYTEQRARNRAHPE
jgi:hypothetical protein